MLVVRIVIEDVKYEIEEADDPRAVALVRQVPLAVPVRVRHEDDAEFAIRCCSSRHALLHNTTVIPSEARNLFSLSTNAFKILREAVICANRFLARGCLRRPSRLGTM